MTMATGKPTPLRSIRAKNYRSFVDVDVEFGPFSVLAGPNGSGKSNLLSVLQLVRDTARTDIPTAVDRHGGYEQLHRATGDAGPIELTIEAEVTENASPGAPDEYILPLDQDDAGIRRTEDFQYKRTAGRGRRLGFALEGVDAVKVQGSRSNKRSSLTLTDAASSGLGTFALINADWLGDGPSRFVSFLSSIRYLDPDVPAARRPSRFDQRRLAPGAANLSAALQQIHDAAPDAFRTRVRDLRLCLPGIDSIGFETRGGGAHVVVAELHENGLRRPIELADASFGTVRMLALLTALHDPDPPALTVIEEVDHGLHPYALDVLADRMREASGRTQIIAASHSPTLVNRLESEELILCDRDPETGESVIPVLTADRLAASQETSGRGLGELWYSGVLDGVPSVG